jgi:formamidopyrimidine-DNA glycosylase
MPELPEVESLRASLEPYIIGQKILDIIVSKPKIVSGSGTKRIENTTTVNVFTTELTNEIIENVTRRAKNIIITMRGGKIILVHLKMTGQLVYKGEGHNTVLGGHPIQESETVLPNKHSHIIFRLTHGILYYNDVRMFGYVLYYPSLRVLQESSHFDNLGLEPLSSEFTLDKFSQSLLKKKGVIKKVFLDQTVVVGLGNIYADEVCFNSHILPSRKVQTLSKAEIEAVFHSIQSILRRAVDAGGSSVANYLLGDGSRGNYARQHKVYGRGQKPCLVCGNILNRDILCARTTVYCTTCQQ